MIICRVRGRQETGGKDAWPWAQRQGQGYSVRLSREDAELFRKAGDEALAMSRNPEHRGSPCGYCTGQNHSWRADCWQNSQCWGQCTQRALLEGGVSSSTVTGAPDGLKQPMVMVSSPGGCGLRSGSWQSWSSWGLSAGRVDAVFSLHPHVVVPLWVSVSSSPLIRAPVLWDQGPHTWPHFTFISLLKTHLHIGSGVPGIRPSTCGSGSRHFIP